MSILSRIETLRKQNGNISINRLEKECGLTRGSMAKWDDHSPSPGKVKHVADYFGVSAEYILYGDESTKPKRESAENGKFSYAQLELLELSRRMSDDELRKFIAAMKAIIGEGAG